MFTHTQGDTNTNPQPDAAFFVQAFAHKFKSLPFNSGINAIEHLLYDKEEDGSNGAELCAGKTKPIQGIKHSRYLMHCRCDGCYQKHIHVQPLQRIVS